MNGSGGDGGGGEITPLFALIFATVLLLTLISMAIAVVFVFKAPSSEMAKNLSATCTETWKTGTAAIFALVAGRAAGLAVLASRD